MVFIHRITIRSLWNLNLLTDFLKGLTINLYYCHLKLIDLELLAPVTSLSPEILYFYIKQ